MVGGCRRCGGGETDPDLMNLVDEVVWLRVGQLGRMIEVLGTGVKECVMLGQLAPRNLFDIRPDFRAMSLLFLKSRKRTPTRCLVLLLMSLQKGLRSLSPLRWLGPWLPEPGYLVVPK